MIIIMASYYVLYIPPLIENQFKYDEILQSYFGHIFSYLWTCNGFINPILYYLTNRDFKIAYLAIIKKPRVGNIQELNENSITQTVHTTRSANTH